MASLDVAIQSDALVTIIINNRTDHNFNEFDEINVSVTLHNVQCIFVQSLMPISKYLNLEGF